jgi:hypothetical protein
VKSWKISKSNQSEDTILNEYIFLQTIISPKYGDPDHVGKYVNYANNKEGRKNKYTTKLNASSALWAEIKGQGSKLQKS